MVDHFFFKVSLGAGGGFCKENGYSHPQIGWYIHACSPPAAPIRTSN